mgnify:CR=1 FL=1
MELLAEIDGCKFNDLCWKSYGEGVFLCRDVPTSSLNSGSSGFETECGPCPYGMTGSGKLSDHGCAGMRSLPPPSLTPLLSLLHPFTLLLIFCSHSRFQNPLAFQPGAMLLCSADSQVSFFLSIYLTPYVLILL